MKEAPEKLYIGRRNYGPLIGGWKSQPFRSKEIESIEYIRKDALLEWARIEKNKCVGNSSWQRFNALQDMIDKLNEM